MNETTKITESVRKKVLEIMELAMLINDSPTQQEYTGNKPTVFVEYSGHLANLYAYFAPIPQKLGLGLQQRVYPFGVAIEAGRWIYEIYLNLLLKWIKERTMTMEENQNDQKENQNTENR